MNLLVSEFNHPLVLGIRLATDTQPFLSVHPLPNTFSKQERALLRRLAEEAWESELYAGLEALFEAFCRWADSGMSAFELNDRIHEFHNGISRELYKRYATSDPGTAVAYAIAAGYLDEDAIAPALLVKLTPAIEMFRASQEQVRGS